MKQSRHLNPSEEIGTGCPVTSKYGRTPPNKHGDVGRQQEQLIRFYGVVLARFLCSHIFGIYIMIPWMWISDCCQVTVSNIDTLYSTYGRYQCDSNRVNSTILKLYSIKQSRAYHVHIVDMNQMFFDVDDALFQPLVKN